MTPTTFDPTTKAAGAQAATGPTDTERRLALGGYAFVALGVLSTVLPGAPPANDATPAKITAYLTDHAGAIKAGALVGGLSMIGLFCLFGALWRAMARAEGERPVLAAVAAIGLTFAVALATAGTAITTALAFRVGAAGDSVAVLWILNVVLFSAAGLGVATFLTAVCLLNRQTAFLPGWTNIAGGVAAAAFLVTGLGMATDSGAIGAIGFLAFFTWCVWTVGVTARLARRA